ncbi:MAG: nicotinate phosphoribosyltransferase [Cyclobacteriaceae bacterium]
MNNLQRIYKESLGLLTDFYQLTMSYGYFKKGMAEREAVFNLFFRSNPFSGGYTVMAGLSRVIDYLNNFKFSASDIDYLATLKDGEENAYFDEAFLAYLADMKFECTIDAQPDGSIIFPHEPVIRVRGPLIQCQILETPLLTIVGQAALIATKASRITSVTGDEPVMEFGLRRAQGIDGALTGSLSSYIGGCHSTSNVLAGKLFGIPVSGTHSHSWVMAFQSELEAFEAYAEVMPGNCVLLVDTYNTLEGVRKAVKVGLDLKEKGKKLKAIRVDSGDLAYLSIEARKILDVAGLKDTQIVGSNDLDEYLIASLKDQGASITMWGVGTKLITSFDQPALGQVYKMTAIRNKDGEWENRIKLSEQNIKINMPGILNVRRFFGNGKMAGDMIFDERDKMDDFRIIAPDDFTKRKKFGMDTQYEDLLKPIFEQGNQSYKVPSIEESRQYHLKQRNMLDASSRRLVNPHLYPVGLEPKLFERRSELIIKLRNK